jgi:hypothetical protein
MSSFLKEVGRAGGVAQWQSAFLACTGSGLHPQLCKTMMVLLLLIIQTIETFFFLAVWGFKLRASNLLGTLSHDFYHSIHVVNPFCFSCFSKKYNLLFPWADLGL